MTSSVDSRAGKGLLVVGKLLRKAETTDSAEEAEALLAKAQELAIRYSIDLAVARYATAEAERRELVEERQVQLGTPGQKHLSLYSLLFTNIARLNDCSVLLRGTESVVYPVGFGSDLDTVEALYRSLVAQMTRESEDWLATGEYRRAQMHKVTARGVFFTGFVERIVKRLEAVHDEVVEDALREAGGHSVCGAGPSPAGSELSSTALALRAKKQEVSEFLSASYPRLGNRTTRLRRRTGEGARRAVEAGRAAADRAHLRGQQSVGR